jgi:hypothetical protein
MPPFRIEGRVGSVPVRADGELPVLVATPAKTLVVERRALPKRRAPLAFAGWLVALTAIVTVGVLATDGLPAGPLTVDDQTAATTADGSARGHSPTLTRVLPVADVVRLDAPAPTGNAAAGPGLVVQGTMLVEADSVRIVLELDRNRVVGRIDLDVADLASGRPSGPAATFETTFTLPSLRSSGTMWIAVTAYDDLGLLLGSARRAFDVGRLLEAGAGTDGPATVPGPMGGASGHAALGASCRPLAPDRHNRC